MKPRDPIKEKITAECCAGADEFIPLGYHNTFDFYPTGIKIIHTLMVIHKCLICAVSHSGRITCVVIQVHCR